MLQGPFQEGNLNYSVFTTPHNQLSWEHYGSDLTRAINEYPTIIPEYYPPEQDIVKKRGNFAVNSIIDWLNDNNNYLFKQVAELCVQQRKDVRVLDPAYNEASIAFRTLLHFPPVAALSILGLVAAARSIQQVENRRISRRALIGVAGASAAEVGALGVGMVIGPDRVPGPGVNLAILENKFRESQVSQRKIELGKQPFETYALFIYPEDHWKGIKYYDENEQERAKMLHLFGILKNFKVFNPMFHARHYHEGQVL